MKHPPAVTSRIARLQQAIAIATLTLLLFAIHWALNQSMNEGLAVGTLTLTGHAWIIAIEMICAARVGIHDRSPRPRWRDWVRAWYRESLAAFQVFAWRQPFRWKRFPDSMTTCPMATPVAVFIHGFVCNRGFWAPWMRRLRDEGHPYVSVNLEPIFGGIEQYAPLIEEAIKKAQALNPDVKPVLICHSMGGLVARMWMMADKDNRERVGAVVTIASPHRGTWLAKFSHATNGRQMGLEGRWIQELERREREASGDAAYARFVCWYSHTDNIVFPAASATLPGADNRHVAASGHVDLAFHPRVMTESLAILASASSSPSALTDS